MKRIILFSSIVLLLSSCIKNNEDPSWLEINEWTLLDNINLDEGVLTQNITNAWVYVDNELMGVFELPVKIPILMSGTKEVIVFPAILNNGISATKKIYPFMAPYEVEVDLVQNEVVVLNPTTVYYNNVKFTIEDFEDATFKIVDGPAATVAMSRVSTPGILDPAINGGYFGSFTLDETNNFWSGSTIFNDGSLIMDLPSGKDVYLEIDYHNTNDLVTGVLGIEGGGEVVDNPNVQLNQQTDADVRWKKIYIELREIVSGSPNAQYFEFSFQSLLDEGATSGEVNIDNIKAVYF